MTLKYGSADRKIVDAINAAAAGETGETTVGAALRTAADAPTARTAIGAQQAFVAAPSTATSTGTAGQIAFDATHIYVAIGTNSWVRALLAAW